MAQAYQERPRRDIAFEQRVYVPTEGRMGLTFSGSEQESALVPTTKRLAPDWREVLGWDVLDNGLQLTRFVILLIDAHYQRDPPRTRLQALRHPSIYFISHTLRKSTRIAIAKWLIIISEGIANFRRFSLFVFWLFGGVRHFASRQKIRPDLELESESIEEVQTERLAAIGEILDNVAEGCDMLAFLSGNGLFWRAIGLRRRPQGWIQRRRLGLERVGVFVGLASFVMESLVLSRRKKQLLSSYAQSERSMQLEMETFEASPKEDIEEKQLNITSQTDCRLSDHQEASPISVLEENQLQMSTIKRRLHWLRIERICINADLSFGIYEACAPDKDKVVFEAGMGSLAAFLRLLRLWNEARFGTLDL
ncbi:hypothetical protein MYAM1_000178 [Malassezia yamatoensis]|uniref:Uncharacterized protein n=1 Tax=Malassezia yamatoensis TaxID=253288 RepID=A0AAJ5YW69_9BASI|nr:hypothetical protein MYAM1_000178 [Malassezia yamatoensis]